jgi:hypothetical protein
MCRMCGCVDAPLDPAPSTPCPLGRPCQALELRWLELARQGRAVVAVGDLNICPAPVSRPTLAATHAAKAGGVCAHQPWLWKRHTLLLMCATLFYCVNPTALSLLHRNSSSLVSRFLAD